MSGTGQGFTITQGSHTSMSDSQGQSGSSIMGANSPGKGARGFAEGLVTLRCTYDKHGVDTMRRIASSRRTFFVHPEKNEAYDILEGDPVFSHKIPRSGVDEDKYSVHGVSSLNSVGAEAVENFPDDDEMAAEVIKNQIKYIGIARDAVTYDSKNKRQGLAIAVDGRRSVHANYDTPTCTLAEIVVPMPKRLNMVERKRRPGTPANKVVLEIRPYNPRTIESKIMAHLRNYSQDPDKYKKTMGNRYRTTSSWISVIETMIKSSITSWALITSQLAKLEIIGPVTLGPHKNIRDLVHDRDVLTTDDVVLIICKGMALLNGTKSNGGDINKDAGISITPTHMALFSAVKRDLTKKVFFDGRTENFEFGYDKEKRRNPAKEEKTGKPILAKPAGRMLYNQVNHTPELIGALSDVVNRDREWIDGKFIKGGPEGKWVDFA
jgi:hypothetical protein